VYSWPVARVEARLARALASSLSYTCGCNVRPCILLFIYINVQPKFNILLRIVTGLVASGLFVLNVVNSNVWDDSLSEFVYSYVARDFIELASSNEGP